MKSSLVRIGNSRGIRIPKVLLEQCHLGEQVELEAHRNHLVVRSASRPRRGWEDAFREMLRRGDDALLDWESRPTTRWDHTEWVW